MVEAADAVAHHKAQDIECIDILIALTCFSIRHHTKEPLRDVVDQSPLYYALIGIIGPKPVPQMYWVRYKSIGFATGLSSNIFYSIPLEFNSPLMSSPWRRGSLSSAHLPGLGDPREEAPNVNLFTSGPRNTGELKAELLTYRVAQLGCQAALRLNMFHMFQ